MNDAATPVRVDRWLWAARFAKTRTQALEAVVAGHVERDGVTLKPSRVVAPGDRLQITVGQQRFLVDVLATAARRGSAEQARALYAETPESRAERERVAALHRLAAPPGADLGRRPTKRDRRRIDQARGRDQG
ncbi:MAG TPA: RNA-binding S4 domain-containing protein [Candidatus Nanopelagicales bacterium]|nr:RNA-binding S4 domain-containing protein [Candidatus Nanopelagicales bacterium]